jgi:hypothetical protein
MPEASGIEVTRWVRANHRDVGAKNCNTSRDRASCPRRK